MRLGIAGLPHLPAAVHHSHPRDAHEVAEAILGGLGEETEGEEQEGDEGGASHGHFTLSVKVVRSPRPSKAVLRIRRSAMTVPPSARIPALNRSSSASRVSSVPPAMAGVQMM